MRLIALILMLIAPTWAVAEKTKLLCDMESTKVLLKTSKYELVWAKEVFLEFDLKQQIFFTELWDWNLNFETLCSASVGEQNFNILEEDENFIKVYCYGQKKNEKEFTLTHNLKISRFTGELNGTVKCARCKEEVVFSLDGKCKNAKPIF